MMANARTLFAFALSAVTGTVTLLGCDGRVPLDEVRRMLPSRDPSFYDFAEFGGFTPRKFRSDSRDTIAACVKGFERASRDPEHSGNYLKNIIETVGLVPKDGSPTITLYLSGDPLNEYGPAMDDCYRCLTADKLAGERQFRG
jgi:hypothetical protein